MPDHLAPPAPPPPGAERPDREHARLIVQDAIRAYFADRRARVKPFVDRHFSVRGSLALHRRALGLDVIRGPVNLTLALPQAVLRAVGTAGQLAHLRGAKKLKQINILLETDIAKELEWLIHTELLELPFRHGDRVFTRDALAEKVLIDPRVTGPMQRMLLAIGKRADDPEFRARLEHALAEYAVTRAAASEIATGLITMGAGALTVNKLTPGAVTLGPTLAAALAQQSAIASFPLGSSLGSLWYSVFPAVPSMGLVFGLTGGLVVGAAVLAAFAGLFTDPVQRQLGLHQRRLLKMLATLERQAFEPQAPGFAVHDHYVARLLDLFDILGAAYRLARL
ncbi:MAG: hypothetical protein JO212_19100 [Acetobacteraceae bacterium]|nr:hypothetical protein [Acetobacteraceae bacterium]